MGNAENKQEILYGMLKQKQWQDALEFAESLKRGERNRENIQLEENIYYAVLKSTSPEAICRALEGLAFLYQNEYMLKLTGQQGYLPNLRDDCAQKAISFYEQLFQYERKGIPLFQYAHLLYKFSRNSLRKINYNIICQQKEKAIVSYDEAISLLEAVKKDPQQEAAYSRACYGLCRCALECFSVHSLLLDEIMLLFPIAVSLYGSRDAHMQKARRVQYCLDELLKIEELPYKTDNIHAVVEKKQKYENSWDIYYLLGKFFDCTSRFSLSDDTIKAVSAAERYYSYACEIDAARRDTGQAVSGYQHTYTALLTLYLRTRRENDFYNTWKRYHPIVHISPTFQTLSEIRWLIIKGDYMRAKKAVNSWIDNSRKRRIERRFYVLEDILHVLCGGSTEELCGKYKPFHLHKLNSIRKYAGIRHH